MVTGRKDAVQLNGQPDRAGKSGRVTRRAAPERREPQRAHTPSKTYWLLAIVGGIVLVALVVILVFSWNRWWRFDDKGDFQGTWLVSGASAAVIIDNESIKLTSDVAYTYEIDTYAKTLSFAIGNMQGQGRYRFSSDRTRLFITDGSNFSWFSTLGEDVERQAKEIACTLRGEVLQEDEKADNVVVLDLLSHDTRVLPHAGALEEGQATTPHDGGAISHDGRATPSEAPASTSPDSDEGKIGSATSGGNDTSLPPEQLFEVDDLSA